MASYSPARGGGGAGDVLSFVGESWEGGRTAEVPASCVPVLAGAAGCAPRPGGAGRPLYVFPVPRVSPPRAGWLERVAAAALLLALSPLLAAVALAVLISEGRPVFFVQRRFGLDGRPFALIKFRTMVRRSESLQEKLQQRLGQEGRLFKLASDPRVTRTGALLRRTFLDELPQLANVLRGEMRFVGPRPLPESDRHHYVLPAHALRLKALPGMTGLWQVSGRNVLTFDEMCLLDLYYLSHRSASLDLRILWRTARLVLQQIGVKSEAEGGG